MHPPRPVSCAHKSALVRLERVGAAEAPREVPARRDGAARRERTRERIGVVEVESRRACHAVEIAGLLGESVRREQLRRAVRELPLENVERCAVEGSDLTSGWGRFWDGSAACGPLPAGEQRTDTRIFHLDQPVLDTPAKTMQTRQLGGGVAVPDRNKSPDDIAPLFACIMAFTAATSVNKSKEKIYASAYASGSDLVFV